MITFVTRSDGMVAARGSLNDMKLLRRYMEQWRVDGVVHEDMNIGPTTKVPGVPGTESAQTMPATAIAAPAGGFNNVTPGMVAGYQGVNGSGAMPSTMGPMSVPAAAPAKKAPTRVVKQLNPALGNKTPSRARPTIGKPKPLPVSPVKK